MKLFLVHRCFFQGLLDLAVFLAPCFHGEDITDQAGRQVFGESGIQCVHCVCENYEGLFATDAWKDQRA